MRKSAKHPVARGDAVDRGNLLPRNALRERASVDRGQERIRANAMLSGTQDAHFTPARRHDLLPRLDANPAENGVDDDVGEQRKNRRNRDSFDVKAQC